MVFLWFFYSTTIKMFSNSFSQIHLPTQSGSVGSVGSTLCGVLGAGPRRRWPGDSVTRLGNARNCHVYSWESDPNNGRFSNCHVSLRCSNPYWSKFLLTPINGYIVVLMNMVVRSSWKKGSIMVEGAPNHGCLLAYFIIITLGFTVDISNYLLMGWRSTFNCGALPVCKYEYLYLLMCPWVIVWITATDNQQIRHKWSAANWVMGWYSWQKWAIRSNQRHAELKILSWPTQELWALVRSWQSNGFAVWICLGSQKESTFLDKIPQVVDFPLGKCPKS